MNSSDTLIDDLSLNDYVREYTLVPNLLQIVQQSQQENPDIAPLGISPTNVGRTIESLNEQGITTIGQLDRALRDKAVEINEIFDQYDRGAIAAKHVYTPIYILLENVGIS